MSETIWVQLFAYAFSVFIFLVFFGSYYVNLYNFKYISRFHNLVIALLS